MQGLKLDAAVRDASIEVSLGFQLISMRMQPIALMEHGGEAAMAQTVIDQLVKYARHREHVALDPRVEHWVLVAGPGIENVIGRLYRGFVASDFRGLPTARCAGALLPEDSVAHPCAEYPACLEWASFQFGVLAPIHDFFLGQSWETGDTIWTCPRHAREVYEAQYYWDRIGHLRKS